jgi:hypothetical protein
VQAADRVEDELVQKELADAKKKRTGRSRIVGIVVAAAIIGVVFAYLLPKIADYAEVWEVVSSLSWQWVVALVAVTIVNVLSNAPPWTAALPGLGFLHALRVTSASSALSLVFGSPGCHPACRPSGLPHHRWCTPGGMGQQLAIERCAKRLRSRLPRVK